MFCGRRTATKRRRSRDCRRVPGNRISRNFRGAQRVSNRDDRRPDRGWHVDCLNACVDRAQPRNVKRIDIMETPVPDLAQHFSANATISSVDKPQRDADVRAEEAELEQLADRVSAARSVF
jgi:hypothetical protein